MFGVAYITQFPKELKVLTGLFLIVLSIGFYSGLSFVNHTTQAQPEGIVENYNGNEGNESATTMKFRKSDHEMHTILHTHFLSLALIFFILGILIYGSPMNSTLRKFLMIEPLISVILTFGGIYFIWKGYIWMTYIVMLSGIAMTLSYSISILLIFSALFRSSKPPSS